MKDLAAETDGRPGRQSSRNSSWACRGLAASATVFYTGEVCPFHLLVFPHDVGERGHLLNLLLEHPEPYLVCSPQRHVRNQ